LGLGGLKGLKVRKGRKVTLAELSFEEVCRQDTATERKKRVHPDFAG